MALKNTESVFAPDETQTHNLRLGERLTQSAMDTWQQRYFRSTLFDDDRVF